MSGSFQRTTVRSNAFAMQIEGMTSLRAALRDFDAQLPKELQGVNKQYIEQTLVPKVRAAAAFMRGAVGANTGYNARTKRSRYHWADVVDSIRARATQTETFLVFGSLARGKDWMLGWEFGSVGNNGLSHRSRRNPTHPGLSNTSQYPRWKGNKAQAGYFLFPMVRAAGPDIERTYLAALEGFFRRKGFLVP